MSGNTVTRSQLSEAVYQEVGLSRNESADLVEAVLEEISDALVRGELVLHVADRGPGIPEGDLERIFQPFFSRRAGGTGLGLSIVQRIVSAIGGRIEVASGPKGSDFSLVFPEAEP